MKKKAPKRLQVQISDELYLNANKRSNELGFDSVNQVIKLMLQGFANNDISFGFFTNNKKEDLEILDLETRKNILKSLKEISNGEFVEIDMNKACAVDELSKLWKD